MDSDREYDSQAVTAVHVLFGQMVSTMQPNSENEDEQSRTLVVVGRHCESDKE